MAAPVMPVSLSVSQFLLFFDCFYSGRGASRARTATQASQGVVGFKFIEPARVDGAKNQVTAYPRKLSLIQPIIAEIQPRVRAANAFITHAIFRSGSTSFEKQDAIGHWAIVLDEDADKGEFVTLPHGVQPTFIIQTSRTGETVNRQYWFIFDRIISAAEGAKLCDLIHRKCGGDGCVKNPAQFFRLPGTLNHPFLAKLKRERSPIPQPVRIVGGTCDVH
jgi:hypothetical protein